MKLLCAFTAMVLTGTLLGCERETAPKPPTVAELTQIYLHEQVDCQNACQDRDGQQKVIEELEKLDFASPVAKQEMSHAEIAKLEEYRTRLNEDVEQRAIRVANAKQAMDEAKVK